MRKTDDVWVLLGLTDVDHLKVRGLPRQHVQAHMECRGSSPLWGADYRAGRRAIGMDCCHQRLSGPAAMGTVAADRATEGDAAKRD